MKLILKYVEQYLSVKITLGALWNVS